MIVNGPHIMSQRKPLGGGGWVPSDVWTHHFSKDSYEEDGSTGRLDHWDSVNTSAVFTPASDAERPYIRDGLGPNGNSYLDLAATGATNGISRLLQTGLDLSSQFTAAFLVYSPSPSVNQHYLFDGQAENVGYGRQNGSNTTSFLVGGTMNLDYGSQDSWFIIGVSFNGASSRARIGNDTHVSGFLPSVTDLVVASRTGVSSSRKSKYRLMEMLIMEGSDATSGDDWTNTVTYWNGLTS